MLITITFSHKKMSEIIRTVIKFYTLSFLTAIDKMPLKTVLGHAVVRIERADNIFLRLAIYICIRSHQLLNSKSDRTSLDWFYH